MICVVVDLAASVRLVLNHSSSIQQSQGSADMPEPKIRCIEYKQIFQFIVKVRLQLLYFDDHFDARSHALILVDLDCIF